MNTVPPCAGKWALFDSTDLIDHAEARTLCDTCPIIDWCRNQLALCQNTQFARRQGGPMGTWAGVLLGDGGMHNPQRLAAEAAQFTPDELRELHAAYGRGVRNDRVDLAERVYQRNRSRNRRVAA